VNGGGEWCVKLCTVDEWALVSGWLDSVLSLSDMFLCADGPEEDDRGGAHEDRLAAVPAAQHLARHPRTRAFDQGLRLVLVCCMRGANALLRVS
jgi:hypothetical protein